VLSFVSGVRRVTRAARPHSSAHHLQLVLATCRGQWQLSSGDDDGALMTSQAASEHPVTRRGASRPIRVHSTWLRSAISNSTGDSPSVAAISVTLMLNASDSVSNTTFIKTPQYQCWNLAQVRFQHWYILRTATPPDWTEYCCVKTVGGGFGGSYNYCLLRYRGK